MERQESEERELGLTLELVPQDQPTENPAANLNESASVQPQAATIPENNHYHPPLAYRPRPYIYHNNHHQHMDHLSSDPLTHLFRSQ